MRRILNGWAGVLFIIFLAGIVNGQATPSVEKINKDILQNLIAKRNGKLLFLNVWATWCPPCREEFPDIVKIADDYKDKNIDFVGLSVDYPDEIESKIIPFLKSNKVNFKIFVNDFESDESLINMLGPDWNGPIPATFIFDENGIQKEYLLGSRSYEQFAEAIDSHLITRK